MKSRFPNPRNLAICSVLCLFGAIPSFAIGLEDGFSVPGMLVGVALFILAYTRLSQAGWFVEFADDWRNRRALQITYLARILLSLAFPIGRGVDEATGFFSFLFTSLLTLGAPGKWFLPTVILTLVQGVMLNFVLLHVFAVFRVALEMFVRVAGPPATGPSRWSDPVTWVVAGGAVATLVYLV